MFHKYPYTDFHEMNLDWFLKKFNELLKEWNGISGNLKEWLNETLQNWLDDGTIASYLNNLVIVNDYGAKGDGVTDDTAAIQKCIDENPVSTILFKEGTYCISDTIELWGASGGQYVLFGGATIKWIGGASQTIPMILVKKDYEPTISSMCRIIGGNFDANNSAGIAIQNTAFYTEIAGSKLFDFTNYGIVNGTLGTQINKSTQAKIHDCHIFMLDTNNWSAENRIAIRLAYPDNQISNVVTNRCKYAYELISGGNSFSNCHSTVQYPDYYDLTAETLTGGHILLNPPNSGITQENVFTNCYFNVGKYVVHNPYRPTNLVTHIDNSHFTYYGTTNLEFTLEAFLWFGRYGNLITKDFDIVIGGNCNFRDYFLGTGLPSTTGIPILDFNNSPRHPEADICVANNYMKESDTAHILAGNGTAVPEANKFYEVGGVLFSYVDSADFSRIYSEPIKIDFEVEYTHCEALINLNADNSLNISYVNNLAGTDIHRLYVGELMDKMIGGRTYKYLPFYIYCTDYLGLRLFLKLACLGTNNKCYVVNRVDGAHAIENTPAATRLFYGSQQNIPDNFVANGITENIPTKSLFSLIPRNIAPNTSVTFKMNGNCAFFVMKRDGYYCAMIFDYWGATPAIIAGELADIVIEKTASSGSFTITNNRTDTIAVYGLSPY